MRKLILIATTLFCLALMTTATVSAAGGKNTNCMIPRNGDVDNNNIGDAGVQVVCTYDSVYAYDAGGDYYWDLGDGRIYTSPGITQIADLDADTLSTCFYRIHTKGDFNNDPFMDSGVISNMIHCKGHDGNGAYHYQIVSEDDPRYVGNPEWAIWGTWEYHVLTESHNGNLVAHFFHP